MRANKIVAVLNEEREKRSPVAAESYIVFNKPKIFESRIGKEELQQGKMIAARNNVPNDRSIIETDQTIIGKKERIEDLQTGRKLSRFVME